MSVPKTDALPLGYTPVFDFLLIKMEKKIKERVSNILKYVYPFPKGGRWATFIDRVNRVYRGSLLWWV